jgi:hypothetical protein
MFQTDLSVKDVCIWFREEMMKLGFDPDGDICPSKHDYAFSVRKGAESFSFSFFNNPSLEKSVCLYVKPQLGFFAAIRGKNDTLRELATSHSNTILSNSNHVSNLGWYTETRVWKEPTNAP